MGAFLRRRRQKNPRGEEVESQTSISPINPKSRGDALRLNSISPLSLTNKVCGENSKALLLRSTAKENDKGLMTFPITGNGWSSSDTDGEMKLRESPFRILAGKYQDTMNMLKRNPLIKNSHPLRVFKAISRHTIAESRSRDGFRYVLRKVSTRLPGRSSNRDFHSVKQLIDHFAFGSSLVHSL